MGKADVIQAIFDSYGLIKGHYREVAMPLIFLLIVSGIGHIGGSGGSFGGPSSRDSGNSGSYTSNAMGGLVLNAMGALETVLALGAIAILAIILVFVAVGLALYVLGFAVQFYIFEHFYALLLKKKIAEDWKARMKRHTVKVLVIQLFWVIVTVLFFLLPALQMWNSVPQLSEALKAKSGAETLSLVFSFLSPVILLLLAAALGLVLVGFLIAPLWIYFAMDGLGFFESVGKAVSMVMGNPLQFIIIGVIFGGLGIAGWVASVLCCCFAWIISPIIDVFLTVLYGVTLMKVKLALEGK